MADYNAFIEPRRRGRILQVLAQSNSQGCNVPLVRTILRNGGYRVADETLAIDLSFLSSNGFVRLREIGDVQLAALTTRGRDVVSGDLIVPGIDCGDGDD